MRQFILFILLFVTYNIQAQIRFNYKDSNNQTLIYEIRTDKTGVNLVKYKKLKNKILKIPEEVTYNGVKYKVKKIDEFAFRSYSKDINLEEIEIPNTVDSVGQNCFERLKSLKKIKISKSLVEISYMMFAGCENLSEILIPQNSKLECIDKFAFENCHALRQFVVPDSVSYIATEGSPWRNCSNLINIYVSSSNKEYMSDNGVLYTKGRGKLIQYPNGRDESVFIAPKELTSVCNSAFWGNTNLKEVILPDGLKGIDHISFANCTNLSKVYLPNSLNYIGNGAFYGCPKLSHISINKKTKYTVEDDPESTYNTFMTTTFVEKLDTIPNKEMLSVYKNTSSSSYFTVDSMEERKSDISASTNRRYDNNGAPCALLVLLLPVEECSFSGNIVGTPELKINEWWLYVSPNSKFLKIQIPGHKTITMNFIDYGFPNGVVGLNTYVVNFEKVIK